MEWTIPKTIKKLRGFLGLTGYYRRFVKNYGRIERPLTTLLKKDSFHWNESSNVPFEKLKKAMCTTSVLSTLDFTREFIVECDAFGNGKGALLMKEGRPISFESYQLKGKNQLKPIYEKEMLAILHAVKKWRSYLMGHHFKVKIDHDSLKYFL